MPCNVEMEKKSVAISNKNQITSDFTFDGINWCQNIGKVLT